MILRIASIATVYALQRAESLVDRIANTHDRSIEPLWCPWSLAADAMVPDRQRLFYDRPGFCYPARVHRVDRLGPVVLVRDCAEEERGSVFVFLASREVTDGSQVRRWVAESGMEDVAV